MIIPLPSTMRWTDGTFTFGGDTVVSGPADLAATARRVLAPSTGLPLALGTADADVLVLATDDRLGAEAYELTVEPAAVRITGGSSAGVFYGLQSLRQLLPAAVFRQAPLPDTRWEVPCGEIADEPRFGWRGAHLDVGRHFLPKPFLFRFVDLLAMHKLNVLHLHLTEDQGWRFESHRYPRLTEVGAHRTETRLPREKRGDGQPHGGFYTQDDLRELVAYAADRFVTIVPEVELPGHAQAAIAAYPELGNQPGRRLPVHTAWGVNENVLNAEDSTLRFFQDVYEELLDVFPGRYVHVGGDECPKVQWEKSDRAQRLITERGLADENELQSWFIREMATWLAARDRRLVGWDEILEGGLAPGATVMSWRGEEGGVAAAQVGHDVVMAPGSHTYFDHSQSDDPGEPHAIGGHDLPLERVYGYEPVPAELTAAEASRVLGSQCQLWTEYLPTPRHVEYMAFPRMCAFAEVVWSAADRRSYDDFTERLTGHLARLDALGVEYRPLDGPHPWQQGGNGRWRR